jgi:pre-mRNA-processing factor 19
MSLTCELSGEPLASTSDEVVATPSGHVCLKRLLLAKLSENGGMDPFEPIRERPLSEEQLIGLVGVNSNGVNNKIPPPRSSETSIPNLLQTIQTEYDALVLELFDTRKALEETRKELSQALYQNDAAVRVVARLSMERDAARHELERWNASVVVGGNNDAAGAGAEAGAEATAMETTTTPTDELAPKTKRRRVDVVSSSTSMPLKNDLPQEDLNAMVTTWQQLQPQRKPSLSAAKAAAPTPDDLANFTEVDKKSWHKSTCRSVTCMAASSASTTDTTNSNLVATAGKDKQLIVYHTIEKVVKHTIHLGSVATCVDIHGSLVVAGDEKGKLQVFSVEDASSVGTWHTEGGASIVDVRIHPTTKHLCVATSNGRLVVCCILDEGEERVQTVAQFYEGDDSNSETVQYSCGALHPDGLLYAAGTTKGQVHMWDFKNKVLASTLQEGDADDAVVAVAFSNNGYHLATAHDSAAVRFWDLRKQKTMAVMNVGKELLESVTSLTYDPSGQYVAFGGKGGVKITTVKKWETTASLESNVVSGLVWNDPSIVGTCSNKQRAVYFHGLPKES